MSLSDKIKVLRELKNISKAEMSRILDLDPSNYNRYEKTGRDWTISQIEKIASALGVSVVELLTGEEVREEAVKKNKPDELTLRDYFAAAAIPAIINKYGKVPLSAKWAYEVADDMMAARKGGES